MVHGCLGCAQRRRRLPACPPVQRSVCPSAQALRYEAADDSPLSRFVVSRAARDLGLGVALHWYLYTEWEDPGFGPRAERVHRAFQEAETQVDGP
jgi:Phosphoinositide 3-kinase family, accessory domain (PIK domain)